MDYGICLITQVPIRLERSDRSEMVSQMLFGETCKILDCKDEWIYIYSDTDQYLGWADVKMIEKVSRDIYIGIQEEEPAILTSFHGFVRVNQRGVFASQGSTIPLYHMDQKKMDIELVNGSVEKKDIVAIGKELLGVPYLWGGRTIVGIDCSGFTLNLYKAIGVYLPRDASQQVKLGNNVPFISEAEIGDLCFFDNQDQKIVHVGIYLGNNEIIHASGQVRIDRLDHQGIYNENEKKYTHKLRIIKRINI